MSEAYQEWDRIFISLWSFSSIIKEMLLYTIFRYFHFLAIFALAGALLMENMATKPTINGEDARNLAKIDTAYIISITLVFVCGLTLWLWVGRPGAFYSYNTLFLGKLAMFTTLALLSIYPTIFFRKNRKSREEEIKVPKIVMSLLRIQLGVLAIIPILAFLTARGIGATI